MAKNLIDECKAWLPNFYNNGKWLGRPTLRFNGRLVDDRVVDFMDDFFHFLIESEFLNNCTLIWLNSNLPSVKKALDFYNSQCDEFDIVNEHTAQSKIEYDKKKLSKYFDSKLLFNLMTYPDKYLDSANEILGVLNRKFFNDKEYRQAMVLRLSPDYVCSDIDEYSWACMTNTLERYSKKTILSIESGESSDMTKNMIGYYNYLISNKRLNKVERERLGVIRKLLGIEE